MDFKFGVELVVNISTDLSRDKDYQMQFIKQHLPSAIDIVLPGTSIQSYIELEEIIIKELS